MAIGALLGNLSDKTPAVFEAVTTSLLKLADKQPNQVLLSCCMFCSETAKLPNDHVGHILNLMSKVCSEHIENIDGDTVIRTVEFSLRMMTESNLYEPVVQAPASDILVALGRLHYIKVILIQLCVELD